MKLSLLAVSAAVLASPASAGSCKHLAGFGSDLCANTGTTGVDWVDEIACGLVSGTGCKFDAGRCFQDPSNCDQDPGTTQAHVDGNKAACDSMAIKGCFWKEDGMCDAYDAASCTAEGTGFYKCTNQAFDDLVAEVLAKVDPFDPSTWNISELISDFSSKMTTGCFGKYRECFFRTECGNPEIIVGNFCEDTLEKLCDMAGVAEADCPLDWCNMGVTQGKSLIELVMEYADDINFEEFFTADKIDELRKTIDMIAGGSFDLDWIDFDKDTGKISITIPENSIVSQAEIDDIIARLQDMLSGTSAGIMTSDKGFAVKSVKVESNIAPIDSSKEAWEGKKSEGEGMGAGAVIGIVAACAGVVAAVVGGVVYTRRNSGASKSSGARGGNIGMKNREFV